MKKNKNNDIKIKLACYLLKEFKSGESLDTRIDTPIKKLKNSLLNLDKNLNSCLKGKKFLFLKEF